MKPVEQVVNGRMTIDVKMVAENIGLNEVVVTALGISKESKKLGYAVTQVAGDKIAASTTISPVNALQGLAPGVDIAPSEGGIFAGSKITIRGNSTLKGNNMPIFVVDGVIALYFSPPNRSLFVRKMRGTTHDKNIHPLEIGAKGISVNPRDNIIWDAIK